METYTTRSGKVLALVLCSCGQVVYECDPCDWKVKQERDELCDECQSDADERRSMAWMREDE